MAFDVATVLALALLPAFRASYRRCAASSGRIAGSVGVGLVGIEVGVTDGDEFRIVEDGVVGVTVTATIGPGTVSGFLMSSTTLAANEAISKTERTTIALIRPVGRDGSTIVMGLMAFSTGRLT